MFVSINSTNMSKFIIKLIRHIYSAERGDGKNHHRKRNRVVLYYFFKYISSCYTLFPERVPGNSSSFFTSFLCKKIKIVRVIKKHLSSGLSIKNYYSTEEWEPYIHVCNLRTSFVVFSRPDPFSFVNLPTYRSKRRETTRSLFLYSCFSCFFLSL